MARNDPLPALPLHPPAGVYRHYKGARYEVVGIVRHSEDLSPLVLYRALDDQGAPLDCLLWVRPHAMWSELVTHEGRILPRFAPISTNP